MENKKDPNQRFLAMKFGGCQYQKAREPEPQSCPKILRKQRKGQMNQKRPCTRYNQRFGDYLNHNRQGYQCFYFNFLCVCRFMCYFHQIHVCAGQITV